jgi:hypothetical protein
MLEAMSSRLAAVATAAFMAHLAACGNGDDDTGGDGGETVSCTADARLDPYAGELAKTGERGVLSFRFSDLEPAPPARGNNTFHVQVNDAAGAAMQVELAVDLRMPDHGHGTSVEPRVTADEAPGRYAVSQLYLFMPGVWRIEFEAYAADAEGAPALDNVTLHFCIEG